jgi:hypothetical protein
MSRSGIRSDGYGLILCRNDCSFPAWLRSVLRSWSCALLFTFGLDRALYNRINWDKILDISQKYLEVLRLRDKVRKAEPKKKTRGRSRKRDREKR